MRRFLVMSALVGVAVFALTGAALAAGAGGVSGPSFYVDGDLYRTVGTPTDLSGTGGPDSSFDTIYDLSADQPYNVATSAPGDPGYNGGRWKVHAVTFTDYQQALTTYDTNGSGDFDTAAEVEAALTGGAATESIVKSFECPVIQIA